MPKSFSSIVTSQRSRRRAVGPAMMGRVTSTFGRSAMAPSPHRTAVLNDRSNSERDLTDRPRRRSSRVSAGGRTHGPATPRFGYRAPSTITTVRRRGGMTELLLLGGAREAAAEGKTFDVIEPASE